MYNNNHSIILHVFQKNSFMKKIIFQTEIFIQKVLIVDRINYRLIMTVDDLVLYHIVAYV